MLHHELIPAADKSSRALMVMLHGLGDSIEGYRWFPQAMALPGMNYALVNAPDEYYGGYAWYDFAGDHAPGVLRSRKLLFDLLDDLRQRGFPTELTTLGGFSQGCLMSLDVALRYPHRLAGVVGISGYVFEIEQALVELSPVAREQRCLITHGTMDPIVAFARTKSHAQRLQAAGIRIKWHEFQKAHTIAGEAEMKVIREFVKAGISTAPAAA
jgi:phospholipase/carboxylesterase